MKEIIAQLDLMALGESDDEQDLKSPQLSEPNQSDAMSPSFGVHSLEQAARSPNAMHRMSNHKLASASSWQKQRAHHVRSESTDTQEK